MKETVKFFVAAYLVCVSFNSARAWDAEGHMVVAQIAYNHLQPGVKAKCDALIAVDLGSFSSTGTSNFVTSAAWADDFKTPLGTSIWHYIDLPFSLDGTSTSGVTVASFDVVQAINLSVTNLQNPSLTQSNLAVNLRYLIHFVGDIQQPLHCSTAVSAAHPTGDAGGNSFSLTGTWGNLHSLWDAGGGYLSDSISRPLVTSGQIILNAKAAAVEAAYPYDYTTNLETVPNPMTWATAGMNFAKTNSYVGITSGSTPSTAYTNAASLNTMRFMAQGGHRLADILNTIFGTNAVAIKTTATTNGKVQFSWNGLLGRGYKVQWKQDLTDVSWNDLTNITGIANQPITFTEPLNQTRRYYRISQ